MIGPSAGASRVVGAAFAAILALAPAVRAGVNTWTGGRPAEAFHNSQVLMATDPRDPYVVYAAFQPSIYKSRDGGRTWTRLASFVRIDSLLVHPRAPDTLYMGAVHGLNAEFSGVLKSEDGGLTWVSKPLPASPYYVVGALAGSPTDANTVYAGGQPSLFKSTNGGDSWNATASLSGVIASLVVSPRDARLVYAGSESFSYYYYYYPGAFSRSSDSGETFEETMSEVSVGAIAVDPDVDSRVFVGLTGDPASDETGVRRSDDGGLTFSRANDGLPTGARVSSLILDPAHPSTVYAGTNAGVFRSRDSGANWSPIGQILSENTVDSLAISSDGRRIHAGTLFSVAFHLDLVSGPVDIAFGAQGGARVLRWDSDRLAVQTVDGSDNWTATPYSAASATWTAVAIASGADGVARVLWQNGDGRSALEIVGSGGGGTSVILPRNGHWIPSDVAVGPDARDRLLWTDASGAMHLSTTGLDGVLIRGPDYGPTPGWTAIAVDVAPDGRSWVLWRSADGRAAVSVHLDGVIVTTVKWGATPEWSVEDLAVSSDGRARVLARTASGSMQVWTVGEDGSRSVGATHDSPGLVPRRIAAGSDGHLRVLWGGAHGEGQVWFLDSQGTHGATEDVPVLP